jgi:dihydroxyacid dehydratase/phosphogluconate dehydratase
MTVSGEKLDVSLDWWQDSRRRHELRAALQRQDGIDPDDVIMSPERAKSRGLTPTLCFPVGNIAPEGSVIKSTAIDPTVVGPDGVYRKRGPARVFISEQSVIQAIKNREVREGDVIVLICGGPMGSGMQEIYQVTSALRHLAFGKHVAVITDARFSGVSTGACIGHVSPEALAGGAVGKIRDGDVIEIVVDCVKLEATVNFVGENGVTFDAVEGARRLGLRAPRPDLAADPALPEDTRLWAALVQRSGGVWAGCVYDADAIISAVSAHGLPAQKT